MAGSTSSAPASSAPASPARASSSPHGRGLRPPRLRGEDHRVHRVPDAARQGLVREGRRAGDQHQGDADVGGHDHLGGEFGCQAQLALFGRAPEVRGEDAVGLQGGGRWRTHRRGVHEAVEVGVAQGEVGVGVPAVAQVLDGVRAGPAAALGRQVLLVSVVDHRRQQALLVPEVAVEGRGADPRRLADRPGGDIPVGEFATSSAATSRMRAFVLLTDVLTVATLSESSEVTPPPSAPRGTTGPPGRSGSGTRRGHGPRPG